MNTLFLFEILNSLGNDKVMSVVPFVAISIPLRSGQEATVSCTHQVRMEKFSIPPPTGGTSPRYHHCWHPDIRLLASRTSRRNCPLYTSHPVYRTQLLQSKLKKIIDSCTKNYIKYFYIYIVIEYHEGNSSKSI